MIVNKPIYDSFIRNLYSGRERRDPHLPARTVTSTTGDGPLDHTKGRLYLCDGYVFYSPNCSRVVGCPPPVETNATLWIDPLKDDLELIHQPCWWSEETAYLAFVPLKPKYIGLPFETLLNIPQKATCIDQQGYSAESWRKLGWYRLETMMHHMMDSMTSKYSLPPHAQIIGRILSLKTFFKKPQEYKISAQHIVSWFCAITAQMSWCLAVATTLDDELKLDKIQRPSWLEFLSKSSAGLYWDEVTLTSVRKTVGGFGTHTPRVGVFLNILRPPDHQYSVDWLMQVHIPVYYPWGAPEAAEAAKSTSFARLAPCLDLIQEFHTILHRQVDDNGKSQGQIATHYIKDDDDDENVNTLSHARSEAECCSWHHFSQQRQENTMAFIQQETSAQTATRLQREREPPTVNTRVFVWEGDEYGLYTRIPIRKYDNFDTLASFKPSQKLYNSVYNEWECTYDFVVNERAAADVDDDRTSEMGDIAEYYDDFSDNWEVDTPILGPDVPATFAFDHDNTPAALTAIDMLTLFREYYGFVPPLCVTNEPATLDAKHIMHLRNFVGLSKDQCINLCHHSMLVHMHNFATYVLKHKNNMSRPSEPVDFWDLVFGNRQYLGSSSRLQCLQVVRSLDVQWLQSY